MVPIPPHQHRKTATTKGSLARNKATARTGSKKPESDSDAMEESEEDDEEEDSSDDEMELDMEDAGQLVKDEAHRHRKGEPVPLHINPHRPV